MLCIGVPETFAVYAGLKAMVYTIEVWSWAIHESTGGRISPTAIFYQFVTDAILEELITEKFPIIKSDTNEVAA